MLLRTAFLALLFGLGSILAASDPNTASIQGTVVAGATGKPLAGALVTAKGQPHFLTRQQAQSSANGTFQLLHLPAGAYALCVTPSGDGYLDPCEWGQTATIITLTPGQASNANMIAASVGSVLKIRVQDTSQLLFQKTKSGYLPDLLVGIFGPNGMFYPAHVDNRDVRGLDLQLTIPFNMKLSLSIASKSVKLLDSTGLALPTAGSQASVQHTTGDPNPQSFTFTVAGINP